MDCMKEAINIYLNFEKFKTMDELTDAAGKKRGHRVNILFEYTQGFQKVFMYFNLPFCIKFVLQASIYY